MISMDGELISVRISNKKPLLIGFLWGNFGFYVVLDKEWIIFSVYVGPLGPCWAFGGPDFDF